jgi:PAP2 superfamily
MRIFVIVLFCVFYCNFSVAQTTMAVKDSTATDTVKRLQLSYKQFIIPGILIGYGAIGMHNDQLLSFNTQIRNEVKEDIDEKTSIDDFSQWAPAGTVFALNAFGVKGKNSLRDESVVLVTSYVIMSSTVFGLKSLTKVERPDGSSNNSFPSGHTANAFAGAEFLWQEYKDKSVWIGVAGFTVAAGTGIFRMYNNRHWLTDVAAGAGIGILSTKLAYWLNPYITKKLFHRQSENSTSFIMPFYDGQHAGLGYVKTF